MAIEQEDERVISRGPKRVHAVASFTPTLFGSEPPGRNGRRKSPSGIATSDLIFSADVATNAKVFERVLRLHVPRGAKVADVTWGKGVFWEKVPPGRYLLKATDISMGIDCRELPYKDSSIDCVVLDPPYMEGLFRKSTNHKLTISSFVSGKVRSS